MTKMVPNNISSISILLKLNKQHALLNLSNFKAARKYVVVCERYSLTFRLIVYILYSFTLTFSTCFIYIYIYIYMACSFPSCGIGLIFYLGTSG